MQALESFNVSTCEVMCALCRALPAIDKTLSVREAQRMATEGVN